MATPISEECYSDEEDDFVTSNSYEDGEDVLDYNDGGSGVEGEGDMSGWQLAARGIKLALNNRIEDAQNLLRVDSSCIHRQAGFCYLTFIVSLNLCIIFGWDSARVKFEKKCNLGKPHGFPYSKSDNLFAISIS